MKKTFALWKEIIGSPSRGFASFDEKPPFALALIIILLLVLVSTAILIPVLTSESYADAVVRVQINTLKERGTELSAEQAEAIKQSMSSGPAATITLLSSTFGGVIGFGVILLITALLFKLILLIAKEKAKFRILFSILVYISIFSIVQMLVKNGITVLTDYERALSKVYSTNELQFALSSPVSLGALFNPSTMNPSVYYIVDALTDIFNWLYYGYLYAGLRWALNINARKALVITIVSAVIFISVGFVFTLIF